MGHTVSGRAPAVVLALVLPMAIGFHAGGFSPREQAPLTTDEGHRLAEKLAQIVDHAAREVETPQTVVLTEREVNAYLRFQGASLLPLGVQDAHLTLETRGGIGGRAVVDLDAVSQSRERGLFDPLAYLGGTLEVTAQGSLEAADGVGQIAVQSVSVGGVPVPQMVLEELVRHYSRSETHPDGIDLAEPFALPYRIDQVTIDVGEAVVVQ